MTDDGFHKITEEQDMTCSQCNCRIPAGEWHWWNENNKEAEEHLCNECGKLAMDAGEAYLRSQEEEPYAYS